MSQNTDPVDSEATTGEHQVQVSDTHTESRPADDSTDADETVAGPAERNDPGNDNPATTAPVE